MHLNKNKCSSCLSYKRNSTNEEYKIPVGAQLEGKLNRNTKGIETNSTVNVSFDLFYFEASAT